MEATNNKQQIDDLPPDIFKVDKYNLDVELESQAEVTYKWAAKLAKVKEKLDRAKAARDVVEAEVSLDIRKNPENYDVPPKATEKVISDLVEIDSRYKEARERVIELQYKVDIYQARVNASNDKKFNLQKMIELFLNEYYAEPSVNGSRQNKYHREKEEAADKALGVRKR